MKRALTLVLLTFPACAFASSTYNCSLREGRQVLWSGPIVLKDGRGPAAAVLIVRKDGTAVTLDDILKRIDPRAPDGAAAAMKPYDGLWVVGLRRQKDSLDLNIGQVDSANAKDAAPAQVDGWASARTKVIGVTDFKRGLSALCRTR